MASYDDVSSVSEVTRSRTDVVRNMEVEAEIRGMRGEADSRGAHTPSKPAVSMITQPASVETVTSALRSSSPGPGPSRGTIPLTRSMSAHLCARESSVPLSPVIGRRGLLEVGLCDTRQQSSLSELRLREGAIQLPSMQQVIQPITMTTVAGASTMKGAVVPHVAKVQSVVPSRYAPSARVDMSKETSAFVVHEPINCPPPIIIEKHIEQAGSFTSSEAQIWLRGESSRLSQQMQEILTKQARTFTDLLNQEISKVIRMVNQVSSSSEERFVRLEADRNARAAKLGELEQKLVLRPQDGQSIHERDEVMTTLESVTRDVREQHRSVIAGLTSQKEQQQRTDKTLEALRHDLEAATTDFNQQHPQHQKLEKAILELRRQVQQSLEVVRSEFSSEVSVLRQDRDSASRSGGLIERLTLVERRHEDLTRAFAEQDMQEIVRWVQTEKASRNDLSQALDSYRMAHLQTTAEFRAEVDAVIEKLSRLEAMASDERGSREKAYQLERTLEDLRNSVTRWVSELSGRMEGTSASEVQDLKRLVVAERNAGAELRAELRTELDRSSANAEDRSGREQTRRLEQTVADFRSQVTSRLSDLASRVESAGPDVMTVKDIQELQRLVQGEQSARIDLSQSLDAYRMAHLQTCTELRAELDVALEKLARMESSFADISSNHRQGTQEKATMKVTRVDRTQGNLGSLQGGLESASEVMDDIRIREDFRIREDIRLRDDVRGREDVRIHEDIVAREDQRGGGLIGIGGVSGMAALAGETFSEGLHQSSTPSSGRGLHDLPGELAVSVETRSEEGGKWNLCGNAGMEQHDNGRGVRGLLGSAGGGGGISGGGSLLRGGAALSVASEVAEVLADDRRLGLGPSARGGGSVAQGLAGARPGPSPDGSLLPGSGGRR